MGCKPSRELRTNLTPTDPNQIVGSVIMNANQIPVVALGDSAYLPIQDPKTGESAIIEISINDKKINIYRGMRNRMMRDGVSL